MYLCDFFVNLRVIAISQRFSEKTQEFHREITTNLVYEEHQFDFSDKGQVRSSEIRGRTNLIKTLILLVFVRPRGLELF